MSTNEAKPTPGPQGMIVALLDNALSCIKHNEPDRALWRIVDAAGMCADLTGFQGIGAETDTGMGYRITKTEPTREPDEPLPPPVTCPNCGRELDPFETGCQCDVM